MTYRQHVRVYADRARPQPCGVAVLTVRGTDEHARGWVEDAPVYQATLAGVAWALEHLDRPGSPVELCTNNQAIARVLTGAAEPTCSRELALRLRETLAQRPRTALVHVPNAAGDPGMERAAALAEQALRGGRRAA